MDRKAYLKKYYREHRATMIATATAWNKAHPERFAAIQKKHQQSRRVKWLVLK